MEPEKSNQELAAENKRLTEELEKTRDQLGNARVISQKNYDAYLEYKRKYEDLLPIKDFITRAEASIKFLFQEALERRDRFLLEYEEKVKNLTFEKEILEKKLKEFQNKIETKNSIIQNLGGEVKALRKMNKAIEIELAKLLPDEEVSE